MASVGRLAASAVTGPDEAVSRATDLLELTAELVDIPSESRSEAALVDRLAAELGTIAWLDVARVGDNLVARTQLGRDQRLVLAGHTDTVPAHAGQRIDLAPDRVSGLGATDMKGGLAVMLALARTVSEPTVDLTYVFYAREEIAQAESGLGELVRERPDLLVGDAALLGEPTSAGIEAGCQGTMRVRVTLLGDRAHTSRPWMGRNAVHRAGPLLSAVADSSERSPTIDGCDFREALQVVFIDGGTAGNVVPDRVEITINHRFAPDRTPAQAEAHVRQVVAPWLEPTDSFEVTEMAVAAPPSVGHPLIASLIERNGLTVGAKLGWTDVARFAELGIPAANFGPGDPTLAHTAHEFVTGHDLETVFVALDDLVRRGDDVALSP
jgi:succinyl-diaminopimelate desuccinylase